MSAISIQSVSKRFPNGCEALMGIDVEIQPGSFTVVLGPSGAGKSTLLRVMNGLEAPTGGSVRIGGVTLGKSNLRKLRPGSPWCSSSSTWWRACRWSPMS